MSSFPPLSPSLFDVPEEILWVLHCAEGPVPAAAARALSTFLPRETQPWRLRWVEDWQGVPQRLRERVAAFAGVDLADVSLTATTSSGLATVAQAFPWQAGDEVLLPLGEFPSNYWTWITLRSRGVTVREVPLWPGHSSGEAAWHSTPPTAAADPETRLLAALSPATKILAVSWVRFQDGLVLDLARLARGCAERGVALVVDGIQGAGVLPLELGGIAAFATGGHKGLLAPQGQGFLITHADFRARLAPTGSWLSVEDATDFRRPNTDFARRFYDDGRRFEQGSPNLLSAVALTASLELLLAAGPERIARHVAGLRRLFLAGLARLPAWAPEAARLSALDDAGRLGPIVALHHGGHGRGLWDAAMAAASQRQIHTSVREGYLRIAFHGWHREADLERLLDWLAASPWSAQ